MASSAEPPAPVEVPEELADSEPISTQEEVEVGGDEVLNDELLTMGVLESELTAMQDEEFNYGTTLCRNIHQTF